MYSVFFKMSEIITNVIFGIVERIFLKEKEMFRVEYKLSIRPTEGWLFTQTADRYFAEYRGRELLFRPKFPLLRESESLRRLPTVAEKREPERIYVTWREVASEDFFKDVEELTKRIQKTAKGG